MKLYLFDDQPADAWTPFALSRPCCELLYGCWTLRERLEFLAGARTSGILTRPWLSDFAEVGTPPVVRLAGIDLEEDRLFLSARAVPDLGAHPAAGEGGFAADGPAANGVNLTMAGRQIGCLLPAAAANPDAAWFQKPGPLGSLPTVGLTGTLLEHPWDLVAGNPEQLAGDLADAVDGQTGPAGAVPKLPASVFVIGEPRLRLDAGVTIEPGVVLDTREGPIWLSEDVEVRAGARLAGPLYAGPGSRLLGGSISCLSAGPCSYLRGEIEETVVLGYTNKAHDGFLGHPYLGRWVNLGAMTTNSDLKNNYGTIRVGPLSGVVDTGLVKLGCLLGDHVKTGIGVLLNTGTVIGAGSNLFGSEMPPKWVPPFSWGSGGALATYRRDDFLETATRVLGRRNQPVNAGTQRWLGAVWDRAKSVK
jgi:UDP-N-acetylglucosamine diphosphorylase/glucosamine-1-phosphate N-acetyltransferase